MSRTVYRLPFRLLGIPIQLDLTFLLILPLLAWLIGSDLARFVTAFDLEIDPGPLTEGVTPYLLGFVAALGLFGSILIHELGHSLVGRSFRLRIKSITLWILGGMAQFERIPRNRGREAVMAVAGPITSFLLGALAWLFLKVTPASVDGIRFLLSYLMYMNLILATFNLIPALPLDGGRVLRSLLALRMPYLRATRIAATLSKFLAIGLGLLGFLSLNIWLMLIAFFIFIAVSGESHYAGVSAVLKGIDVKDLMTPQVSTVYGNMRVSDLVQRMFEQRHLAFPVLDAGGQLIGFVTLQQVRNMKAAGRSESQTTVAEIMSREIGAIGEHESALEAFQRISQSKSGRLVVLDSAGNLQGIISKSDLIRTVQLRMVGMDAAELEDAGSPGSE